METTHCSISEQRAREFVENVLKLDYNRVKTPCHENLEYLNALLLAYLNKIPFQNLTFICQPLERQTLPDLKESVDSVFAGVGGLCWTNNSAFFILLKHLGFNAYLVLSSFAIRHGQDHVTIVANNVVKEGDSYLVEAGLGHPTFSAVSLDFDQESPAFQYSFTTFKYMKNGDELVRLHSKRSKNLDQFPLSQGDWHCVYFFQLVPVSPDYAYECMTKSFAKPDFFFKANLRAVIFNECVAIALKNDDNKIIILAEEDGPSLKVVAEYDNKQLNTAVVEHIAQLFPMIPKNVVSAAVKNYSSSYS